MMKKMFLAVSLSLVSLAGTAQNLRSNMDPSVKPGDARVWAGNSTPEYTAMLVNSDVHSPNRLRVMAALPMIDTWYDAFNIKPTDNMFIPNEKMPLVW